MARRTGPRPLRVVEPDEVPAQVPAEPPQWLAGRAREVWERSADALDGLQGHVTSADEAMLTVWATTVARYERAEQEAAAVPLTVTTARGVRRHPILTQLRAEAELIYKLAGSLGFAPDSRVPRAAGSGQPMTEEEALARHYRDA